MKNIRIDSTSVKILETLLGESRTSFTDIAKNCNLSVGAARTRYKYLKRAGIINGEIMQVNPYALGYKCIGNIGISTSPENEEAVIEFLKKELPMANPMKPWGKHNIWVLVAKKNIEEWAAELHRLESNPHIKLVDPLIWISPMGMDHPENLKIDSLESTRREKNTHPSTAINGEQTEIADIDRQIARILIRDSRTSFRKIGKQLNISTKKVIQRYNKLRKNVLTFSTVTLDLKKLGYYATARIFLKGERSKMAEISNRILQMPNMLVFIRLIGSYDLLAIAALEDFDALMRLQKEMRAIGGIEQLDIFVTDIWRAWPANVFASLLG